MIGAPFLDHDEIARLYRSGLTQKQVARRACCSQRTIQRILRLLGITERDGGQHVRAARIDGFTRSDQARARYRRELLRKHRFLNAVFPPFPEVRV